MTVPSTTDVQSNCIHRPRLSHKSNQHMTMQAMKDRERAKARYQSVRRRSQRVG